MRVLLPLVLAAALLCGCNKNSSEDVEDVQRSTPVVVWSSDAENVGKKGDLEVFYDDTMIFRDANLQSGEYSRSGQYSVKLDSSQRYGFTTFLPELKEGDLIEVSCWRKISESGQRPPSLTIQSENEEDAWYFNGSLTREGDWEKIYGTAYIEKPFPAGELKVYMFNPGSEPEYVDDIRIALHENYTYPKFNGPAIELILQPDKIRKLERKRSEAFRKGTLIAKDDDWVEGQMIYKGDTSRIELRLKGDWLDHLKGKKWSYRIKVKGNSFDGMRTFSLHTPAARNFVDEWVIHRMYEEADVLTTRYGFIPLLVNGESRGLYAYEEHFDKQLVENKKRREGPILKLDEDPPFAITAMSNVYGVDFDQPLVTELAEIQPFRDGKTRKSPGLRAMFYEGQKLLYQHQHLLAPASEIYHIDKLARLYAIADIAGSHHGLGWHNQRFYFNPVTCKLEPIAYDCFTNWVEDRKIEISGLKFFSQNSLDLDYFAFIPFDDAQFGNTYSEVLTGYIEGNYLQDFLSRHESEIDSLAAMISAEFEGYSFDRESWQRSFDRTGGQLAEFKQKYTGEEDLQIPDRTQEADTWQLPWYPVNSMAVKAYFEDSIPGGAKITVINSFQKPLELLGFGTVVSLSYPFDKPMVLEPHYLNMKKYTLNTSSKWCYYRVPGTDIVGKTEIRWWPFPSGKTPRQQFEASIPSQFVQEGKDLRLSGNATFNRDVHIPSGYRVVVAAGTQILINGSRFITESPVFFNGTEDQPITVNSSNAQGFTVLNAEGRSQIAHTTFSNFDTQLTEGWTLTGAVNFYESDVDISSSVMTGNVCEDGLNIIRSDFSLIDSEISDTFSDGFDADYCTGVVRNCVFKNSGNDCIDFSTSTISIADCRISGAGDKGISGGENSTLTISNIVIDGANIGIAAKDYTTISADNIEMKNCHFGYAIYQKKPEYGPAKIYGRSMQTSAIDTLHLIETGSLLEIDGKEIEGDRFIDLDALYDV